MLSVADPAQFPPDLGAEVAFAGRSNSGKSSAINALTGRRTLARTSKTPGRTRLLNYFELAHGQRLVDLPGYGYAAGAGAERDQWAALIAVLARRASLRGLVLLVDARRGVLAEDRELLHWAAAHALPVHMLLSKSDKLGHAERSRVLATAANTLGSAASVQAFSAVSGQGLEEARRRLEYWLRKKRTPMAVLGGQATGAD
ncbi:MAG: ribosome biogenesis GTP-binding protein YsxC [Gammaproteobacteria bacterium]|nr:ribosome biogenesis GTP-binding protein YsxC [Gammaproteobacteria bacterium]